MLFEFRADMLVSAPEGALVGIPVNTVGVGGKGLALWFKLNYPIDYAHYVKCCRKGDISTGPLVVVHNHRYMLAMLPTKYSWTKPSEVILIDQTLGRLVEYMEERMIDDVYLPRLGCGKYTATLSWENEVRPLFVKHFAGDSNCLVNAHVYDWS